MESKTKRKRRKISKRNPAALQSSGAAKFPWLRRSIMPGWLKALLYVLVSAAILGLLVTVGVLITGGGFDDFNPPNKSLELTSQDIDPETTLVEQNLLAQNQLDTNLAINLLAEARKTFSGARLQEVENGIEGNRLTPSALPMAKELQSDFQHGRAAAYTIWVDPNDQQIDDSVDLKLEGVDLGTFPIQDKRYSITLVGRAGSNAEMQITSINESKHTFTFQAETATSQASTRRLHPGKSDVWNITVR